MEHSSISDRIVQLSRFYDGTLTEGPLVGFYLGTYYPLHRFRAGHEIASGPLLPDDLDPWRFLADYRRLYDENREVEGDFIWSGEPFYGVPWLEAICGAAVIADPEHGSMRAEPGAQLAPDWQLPPQKSVDGWVEKALEFVHMLQSLSDGRFPLATTLMRGLGDTLAAIHGSPDFVHSLIDHRERSRDLINDIVNRWIRFANAQLDEIPLFHGGTGTHFYDLWLPGRGVVIQDDAVALLSPSLFEDLFLEAVETLIAQFDSTVMHLHPGSYVPIEPLLSTDLTVIELHRDVGGKSVEELIPVYRRIQEAKPLLVWGDFLPGELELLRNSVDVNRLAVKPVVKSKLEAEGAWRILKPS